MAAGGAGASGATAVGGEAEAPQPAASLSTTAAPLSMTARAMGWLSSFFRTEAPPPTPASNTATEQAVEHKQKESNAEERGNEEEYYVEEAAGHGTEVDKQEMAIKPQEFMEDDKELEAQQEDEDSTASPKNFKHLRELLNRPMGLSEEELKYRRENVTKLVDNLVQNGAQVEAEDEEGNTPLFLSAKKSLPYMSENLIRHGAKVDSRNNYGKSPLIVASKHAGRETAVKIMLDNGAAIEAADVNGSTPLLVARNKRITKMLIEQGANKEAVDKEGNDMLLSAAKQGNYTTVEYWLQSGADVNVKNSANDTAFRIAVKKEFTDIMILLVAYGAKIDTSDLELNDFMETLVGLLECKQIVHSPSQAEMAKEGNETNFGTNVAKQDINLLALDGGGIRGLVLCEMLLMIEKRRKMLYPDDPTFFSKFQWFSGTSTGSIMVLGHVYNGFNAEVGLSFYWHLKNKVFPGIWERLKMGFKDAYTC